MRNPLLVFALFLVPALLCREAASSTVTPISMPLSKVVTDARLIVVATVQQVAIFQAGSSRDAPGVRYFDVRIDEILKPTEATGREILKGQRITVFDPQEMFYHDHADLIKAEVISFADSRYATKVQQIGLGNRLLFFLAGRDKGSKLPRTDAWFLVCGRAYDTLGRKAAVMKRLR